MNPLTARQAAKLAARVFGFYLLYFGVVNLTELPPYWLRAVLSHTRNFHDSSSDVSLAMLCVREILHFVFGALFFFQPRALTGLLLWHFYDESN